MRTRESYPSDKNSAKDLTVPGAAGDRLRGSEACHLIFGHSTARRLRAFIPFAPWRRNRCRGGALRELPTGSLLSPAYRYLPVDSLNSTSQSSKSSVECRNSPEGSFRSAPLKATRASQTDGSSTCGSRAIIHGFTHSDAAASLMSPATSASRTARTSSREGPGALVSITDVPSLIVKDPVNLWPSVLRPHLSHPSGMIDRFVPCARQA